MHTVFTEITSTIAAPAHGVYGMIGNHFETSEAYSPSQI